MKLVQKRFLRDSREFEILDDTVSARIRSPFKERTTTVMLTILNPEPVVKEPFVEFYGRVKCEPLITLLIDKPNAEEFNAFVDQLKLRADQAYREFAGLSAGAMPGEPAVSVFDEPPEFEDSASDQGSKTLKPVSAASIDSSIQMLQRYLDAEEIRPFLDALEALRKDPASESRRRQLVQAFDDLGSRQGAVLTYAPYVGILLSDDPFEKR